MTPELEAALLEELESHRLAESHGGDWVCSCGTRSQLFATVTHAQHVARALANLFTTVRVEIDVAGEPFVRDAIGERTYDLHGLVRLA